MDGRISVGKEWRWDQYCFTLNVIGNTFRIKEYSKELIRGPKNVYGEQEGKEEFRDFESEAGENTSFEALRFSVGFEI